MQTRREQVRAYRSVTRRIVSAVLVGDPETTDLPMRRLGMALFGSVLAAAIVLGGVGAYGLLHPGGGRPADNSLVIERETGARYVYLNGTLYPVANFASALLILGSADPTIQTMSRNSLGGLARSRVTYGIDGAPDSLPDPHALSGLPWSVCSVLRPSGNTFPATRVLAGEQPPGGTALGDGALLVVRQGTTTRYLLWRNHALRIGGTVTLTALGMASATPLPVGSALLNGTLAGPDLRVPTIAGDGTPSGKVIGSEPVLIGSVFHDEHGQHYVMLSGGLATIGETMAALILAGGEVDNPITIGLAGRMLTSRKIEPDGYPSAVPKLVQPTTSNQAAVCTAYTRVTGTEIESTVRLYNQVPDQLVPSDAEAIGVQTNRRIRTADFVTIAGQGAVVQPVPAPGATAPGGTVYLVTAQGIRYAMDNRSGDTKSVLGYGAVTPVAVPLSLVELLPLGPTLSIKAARQAPTQAASPTRSPTVSPSRSARPSSSTSPKPGQSTTPSRP
jgi:type VII secretion protein EccB